MSESEQPAQPEAQSDVQTLAQTVLNLADELARLQNRTQNLEEMLEVSTNAVICIECGQPLGMDKSIYKHTINCLALPDKGIDNILKEAQTLNDERGRRIVIMMTAAKERRE